MASHPQRAGEPGVNPPSRGPAARYRGARVRALVLINPMSGRGRGAAAGESAVRALSAAGHEVRALTIREWDEFADAAEAADLAVIVGGDGTVHHSLELLLRERALDTGGAGRPAPAAPGGAGPAIYHVPTGTENLFAREFGMSRDPAALVSAAAQRHVRAIDIGRVRGWPFAIMVSVGPDASVIHRVNHAREGPITHASYALPVLTEAIRPALCRLRVTADGRTLVDGRRGMLVVANMRQYAMRIDPAVLARPDDALLDAVFFPAASTARLSLWLAMARLRLHANAARRAPGLVYERAASIRVESLDGPAPVQVDGEVGGVLEPGPAGAIEIVVEAHAISVLEPAP